MILLCSLLFSAAFATETESNDTKAQANVLTLNGSNTGAINPAGDQDWWSIATNSDGKIAVTITISNGLNMWCQIYDNDGTTLLAQGYTAGSTTVSKDGLATGTYYIKLFAFYGNEMPAYTISNVLTVPAQANDAEPNGSRAQAKVLPLNNSKTGHVNYYYNNVKDSSDWYKVTTNADGRLRLTMTSANGQNVWAYLFDNDGTTLLSSGYTAGSAVVVNKDGLAAGTYYIRVNTYYTTDFAPYTLADSLFVPTQPNDVEPNGAAAQALTLPLNGSVTGHSNYYYNNTKDSVDWYKVTTNADGRLRITMNSNNGQNVWAYLFDNDGTTQLAASYTAGSSVVVNKDGLTAGTYYIRVNTYYTSEFAPYTMQDSLFSPAQANDIEPNNSRATALTLAPNGSTTGHVNFYYQNKKDSSDWYKVTTTADGMLTINIQSNNGQNVWAYLFDNDGTTVLASAYSSGSTGYSVDGLQPGTYYIRVNTYYTSEWAPYTLTSTFNAYSFANDAEPNNYFSQAKTMPANGTVTGHVNFYYNGQKDAVDIHRLNYTGSGSLSFTVNFENRIKYGNATYTWIQVYRDTTVAPIFSNYYTSTANINLTGLTTQGYYYVKVFMYYNGNFTDFSSYSITNTFTQATKASIKVVTADTATTCGSNTNSITFKCTKSLPPYTVQLYRYGIAYGSPLIITNTKNFQIKNLPQGSYQATAFADGATGTAFGKSATIGLLPPVTGALVTSNVSQTAARANWTTTTCAKFYVVQYHKAGDSGWLTKNSAGNVGFANLTGLTANTTYRWRVQAADSVGKVVALSKPTDSTSFSTLAAAFAISNSDESGIASDKLNNAIISAMPNPAQSQVKIQVGNKINEMLNATLKDVNGRIVWSKLNVHSTALNNQTINVTSMPNGIYMLQVIGTNNKPIATQKIIVAH